jgi:hypothetical protein
MVIHPTFGPWIALRFALVLNVAWSSQLSLHATKPVCNERMCFSEEEGKKAELFMEGKEYSPELHVQARKMFSVSENVVYDDEQINYHYHL